MDVSKSTDCKYQNCGYNRLRLKILSNPGAIFNDLKRYFEDDSRIEFMLIINTTIEPPTKETQPLIWKQPNVTTKYVEKNMNGDPILDVYEVSIYLPKYTGIPEQDQEILVSQKRRIENL